MSQTGPTPYVPMSMHLAPPSGLPEEWRRVYQLFADQVSVIDAFHSDPDAHRLPVESLSSWFDGLQTIRGWAGGLLPALHGRAQRTWCAGAAIDRAVSRFCSTLHTVVLFLTHPLPVTRGGEPLGAEEQGTSSRTKLGEQRRVDWAPLMAELACAVTTECGVYLGLSKEGPVTVVPPEISASDRADPPAGGPEGGCRVRYGENVVEVEGRIYAVIEFIWRREFVQFDDLKSAVNEDAQDGTVHTWISRANLTLAPLNLPWRLEADGVNRMVRKSYR